MLLISKAQGIPPGKVLASLTSLENVSWSAGSRSAGVPPGTGHRKAVRGPVGAGVTTLRDVVAAAPPTPAWIAWGGVENWSANAPPDGALAEILASASILLPLTALARLTAAV